MTRSLRVALVGFGWVNRKIWFPRLQADPRFRVVGLFDPAFTGPSPGEDVAVASDQGQLLALQPDLALVATPNHLHYETAGAALDTGVTTLVEKPACLSTAALEDLAERASAAGARLLVSQPSAYRRDVRLLKEWVRNTCVGPVSVSAEWLRRSGVPRPGSWFTRRAQAGGGALLDLGWHLADVAFALWSDPRPTEVDAWCADPPGHVSAKSALWRGDTPGDGTVDVETEGKLYCRYEDGSTLRLHAAWTCDVEVDTTRIEVRGRDADGNECEVGLLTTFGFSPERVPRTVLRFRRGAYRGEQVVEVPPGHEYDAQIDDLAARLSHHGVQAGRTDEFLKMELFERAYRVAGRPLDGQPAADRMGTPPC